MNIVVEKNENENTRLRNIRNEIIGSSVNKTIYIKNGALSK